MKLQDLCVEGGWLLAAAVVGSVALGVSVLVLSLLFREVARVFGL